MSTWERGLEVPDGVPSSGGSEPGNGTVPGVLAGLPDTGEPRLMETLLRFEQAHRLHSAAEMRACFHDEALIESVASNGAALGADETVQALQQALDDGVYSIRDWRYEEIASQLVLSWTGARHLVAGQRMRDEVVCRLHSGRDGLMWRVKLFRSREEALEHLDRHGPDLGLVPPAPTR
jgi:hypothetical protein